MANVIRHFFGAYLDVEVKIQTYDIVVRMCANGHTANSTFCPACGAAVRETRIQQQRYVTDHYELLDDDFADTLFVITPPERFGTGHVILRANQGTDTVWMEIDDRYTGETVKPFPTDAEQQAMKAALMALPAVQVLREHPKVASVNVWAGYVEDSEY